jgi:hypothetical protein
MPCPILSPLQKTSITHQIILTLFIDRKTKFLLRLPLPVLRLLLKSEKTVSQEKSEKTLQYHSIQTKSK